MSRIVNRAALGLSAVLAAALVLFDLYALVLNGTNHTGLPVSWGAGVYAASSAAAAAVRLMGKARTGLTPRVAWCVLAVSAFGLMNILAFDALNIMVEYERWLAKGMPDRPF